MEILKRFEEALHNHLSLRSFPVAIKLLESGEDVVSGTGRPLRDLGQPIRPCEGWHFVRHSGVSVTMLEEDFSTACPTGVLTFGLLEPVKQWINGDLSYGIYTGSRKAARNMESHVFRLETGKYRGVTFTTLGKANFDPDLIMIFCNSNDVRKLTSAAAYATGEPMRITVFARNLCSEGVVQPFQNRRPVIAIPCGGDRRHGGTNDDEIVFTTPLGGAEVIMQGLENFKKIQRIQKLGDDSERQKRYKAMAKVLDRKLGRS
jgi:uncharacterized protein (DUF169 family)